MKNSSKTIAAVLALTATLLAPTALQAAEVAGVRIEDGVKAGATDLVLNGAGLRTKVFFKVYVAALYAPRKNGNAAELMASGELRRLNLHLMRDIDATALLDSLREGLANNHSEAELAALKADTDRFAALMMAVGNGKSGDVIGIDFSAQGTAVTFNGQARGNVPGPAFGRALLRVWLGENPAQTDLKKSLLGS